MKAICTCTLLISALLILAGVLVSTAPGQDSASAAPAAVAAAGLPAEASGTRRALIVCGLPGDAEHRKLFGESLELLYTGLTTGHGFASENVHVLWGDETTDKDPAAVRASRGIASRESIAAAAQSLAGSLQPDDAMWVFMIGHTHYDGRYSWLNIAGDDLHQLDFGRLFEGLRCREQVFFITTAASGFYQKSLAMPGRIVIAATEADLEVNETLYPHKLARGLSGQVSYGEMEMDRDGQLSLLDLYLWAARETAQEYVTGMLLATEHALIDDNGDGRGTEVQIDYLSEELGGRLRASDQPPAQVKGDGQLAQRLLLTFPPSPPVPLPQPVEGTP